MICMWFPMMRWNAIVIYVLVSWFAIEAFGWAANLFPDDMRARENRRWIPFEVGSRRPVAATARAHESIAAAHHAAGHLTTSSWQERTDMAVMAVSMGYMFYGMELMRMQMGGM
jgi:hypothetical protein